MPRSRSLCVLGCNYLPRIRRIGQGAAAGFAMGATSGWAMDTVIRRFGRSPRSGRHYPLAVSMIVRSRIASTPRNGTPNAMLGTTSLSSDRLLYSAFGWFGFNQAAPYEHPERLRCASARFAVNTMLAGWHRLGLARSFICGCRYGKPGRVHGRNGLLAGLVAITAPSGFVSPVGSVINRLHRRIARLRQRGIRGAGSESRRSGRCHLRSTEPTASGA